jgi:metal-responsive CopG/Arc/MetJ family transcriptional regulator
VTWRPTSSCLGDEQVIGPVPRQSYSVDITKRNTRVLTVSVPPETADDFERIAEAEGRNRSELFREMLRVYRTYEETRTFESLQCSGAAQAARRRIRTEEDVERLIREARA